MFEQDLKWVKEKLEKKQFRFSAHCLKEMIEDSFSRLT